MREVAPTAPREEAVEVSAEASIGPLELPRVWEYVVEGDDVELRSL